MICNKAKQRAKEIERDKREYNLKKDNIEKQKNEEIDFAIEYHICPLCGEDLAITKKFKEEIIYDEYMFSDRLINGILLECLPCGFKTKEFDPSSEKDRFPILKVIFHPRPEWL